jgi:hypothetical protein
MKSVKKMADAVLLLYGGLNRNKSPFNTGDTIKQIWRVDDSSGKMIKDGREMYEFVGMNGDLMLLKSLNEYAARSEDTMSSNTIELAKRMGYTPQIGGITQLHYKYADRFEIG